MRILRIALACLLICFWSIGAAAQSAPLTKADVIALVAGDVLPENIEYWLQRRGVDFAFDEPTRVLLVRVGAPDTVIAALRRAPRGPAAASAAPPEVLDYLVRAGDLLRHRAWSHAQKELDTALRLDADEPALHFVLGRVRREQEDFGGALQEYSTVARLDPDYPEIHTKAAYLLYRRGQGAAAVRAADQALAASPRNAEAFKNRGLGFDLQGDQNAAIAEYKKALLIKPEYPAVLYNIGIAYNNQKNHKDAAAAFRAAVALVPDDADFHYNLGTVLINLREYDQSAVALAEAKRLSPKRIDIRNNLVIALRRAGKVEAAIREGEELVAVAPNFIQGRIELANALVERSRFDEAVAQFQQAAKLQPRDPEIYHSFGDLLSRLSRHADAAPAYQKAAELDPSAKHFVLQGQNLTRLGEWERARAAFEQAVAVDPDYALGHWWLGTVALHDSEPVRALGHLRTALRLRPDDPRLLSEYGNALEKSGDLEGARQHYRRAVLLDPAQEQALAVESYRRLAAKQPAAAAEAEAVYRQVIAALENNLKRRGVLADCLAELAALYVAQRRPAEALPLYQRATQLLEADGSRPVKDMALVFEAYAELLRKQQQPKEAAAVQARLERIRTGESATPARFDEVYHQAGQAGTDDKAEALWAEAIAIAEKLPPEPSRINKALLGSAGFYMAKERYDKAKELAARALRTAEERYGPVSFHTTQALDALSSAHSALREFDAAEKLQLRQLATLEAHPAPPQAWTHVLRSLALAQIGQRKFEQAEATLRRAVEKSLPPGHPTSAILDTFALLYKEWARLPEAEKYYRLSLAEDERRHGPDHPTLSGTLFALAEVLRLQGKDAEAAEVEARRAKIEAARK